MLHFPLCRESVLGMPRIEIECEFDIVFCFGIRLALYAVFFFFFFFFFSRSDLLSTHLPITRMRNRDQYRMSIRGVSGLALEESKCTPSLEFTELFYLKYKNTILLHVDCFFCTRKN